MSTKPPSEPRAPAAARDEAARTVTIGPGAALAALLALALAAGGGWWVAGRPGWPASGGAGAPGDVLATVDGVPITQRDVDVEFVIQKDLQYRVNGKVMDDSPAAVAGIKGEYLARLVDRWVAVAEAERQGAVVSEADLDAGLERIGQGFGVATSALRDAVVNAPEGLSEADFRAWGRRMLLVDGLARGAQGQAYAERYMRLKQQPVMQVTEQVIAAVVDAERRPAIRFVVDGVPVAPVREGEPAPEIVLLDVDGQTVRLSDFRGRPVMVNFWATWCGPCRIEMPLFVDAHESNADLVVFGVNSQEPPETVRPFIDAFRLTFPVVLDQTGRYSLLYRVNALPTTFFVDREGIVVRAHRGAIQNRPQLKPMVDEILAPRGAWRPDAAVHPVAALPGDR